MPKAVGGLLLAALLPILFSSAGKDLAASSQQAQPFLPPDTFVARLYYEDISDLSQLNDYDLWEYNNLDEGYVLLSLTGRDFIELQDQGWRLTIDEEETAKLKNPDLRPFEDGYRTVDEIYALLQDYEQDNPNLSELVTYGSGTCLLLGGCTTPGGDLFSGYELRALRLSNEATAGTSTINEGAVVQGSKPVFLLIANIHAREITTPEIALRMIEWLLQGYGQSADLTWLLDYHEIWVVPTANPEGHWMVELGGSEKYGGFPFFQRKNLNLDTDGDQNPDCTMWPPSSSWHYGVDLNRNHSFAWGPPGSSDSPCSQTFRGPGPASESETAALQALVSQLIPDQRGPNLEDAAAGDTMGFLLTLHSYSELVLYPWGFMNFSAPNGPDLKKMSDKMASYNGYLSCQPGSCLYGANGTTDDWAYGELGIPAFTFEIGQEFMPPYAIIDEVQWPENQPAFLYAAKIARTPYQTINGPDTANVQALLMPAHDLIKVTAQLDETGHGGQPISGASLSIDVPPWEDGSQPQAMQATDGSFDSLQEKVEAFLPIDELDPGRQIIYVYGVDNEGNAGVVSAVFIDIPETVVYKNYTPFLQADP